MAYLLLSCEHEAQIERIIVGIENCKEGVDSCEGIYSVMLVHEVFGDGGLEIVKVFLDEEVETIKRRIDMRVFFTLFFNILLALDDAV